MGQKSFFVGDFEQNSQHFCRKKIISSARIDCTMNQTQLWFEFNRQVDGFFLYIGLIALSVLLVRKFLNHDMRLTFDLLCLSLSGPTMLIGLVAQWLR